MRAVVRFSIDREKNSSLRNKLARVLSQAGFVRDRNTATYDHIDIDVYELSGVLEKFWRKAHAHSGHGRIDHFWMYADRKVPKVPSKSSKKRP
jgi:hypothetical protein